MFFAPRNISSNDQGSSHNVKAQREIRLASAPVGCSENLSLLHLYEISITDQVKDKQINQKIACLHLHQERDR